MRGKSLCICILIITLSLFVSIAGSIDPNVSSLPLIAEEKTTSIQQAGSIVPSAANADIDQYLVEPMVSQSEMNESAATTTGDKGAGKQDNLGKSGGQEKGFDANNNLNTSRQKEEDKPAHADHELIVRFRTEQGKGGTPAVAAIIHRAAGAAVRKDYSGKGLAGTQLVVLPPGLSVEEGIARYADNSAVLSVQPKYRIELIEMPDDPGFPYQRALLNTGQTRADISAVPVSDTTTGSSGIVIAIPDTGIDLTYPDIAGNLWINPYEIACNGIDDDGTEHYGGEHVLITTVTASDGTVIALGTKELLTNYRFAEGRHFARVLTGFFEGCCPNGFEIWNFSAAHYPDQVTIIFKKDLISLMLKNFSYRLGSDDSSDSAMIEDFLNPFDTVLLQTGENVTIYLRSLDREVNYGNVWDTIILKLSYTRDGEIEYPSVIPFEAEHV